MKVPKVQDKSRRQSAKRNDFLAAFLYATTCLSVVVRPCGLCKQLEKPTILSHLWNFPCVFNYQGNCRCPRTTDSSPNKSPKDRIASGFEAYVTKAVIEMAALRRLLFLVGQSQAQIVIVGTFGYAEPWHDAVTEGPVVEIGRAH